LPHGRQRYQAAESHNIKKLQTSVRRIFELRALLLDPVRL
jgi:hypothetical protein